MKIDFRLRNVLNFFYLWLKRQVLQQQWPSKIQSTRVFWRILQTLYNFYQRAKFKEIGCRSQTHLSDFFYIVTKKNCYCMFKCVVFKIPSQLWNAKIEFRRIIKWSVWKKSFNTCNFLLTAWFFLVAPVY